jgi:TonB family protein
MRFGEGEMALVRTMLLFGLCSACSKRAPPPTARTDAAARETSPAAQARTAAASAPGHLDAQPAAPGDPDEPQIYGRDVPEGYAAALGDLLPTPETLFPPRSSQTLRIRARHCYEAAAGKRPQLRGSVYVQFTLSEAGKVIAAVVTESTLHAPAVERCLLNAVRRSKLGRRVGGGIVIVTYPFEFSPD